MFLKIISDIPIRNSAYLISKKLRCLCLFLQNLGQGQPKQYSIHGIHLIVSYYIGCFILIKTLLLWIAIETSKWSNILESVWEFLFIWTRCHLTQLLTPIVALETKSTWPPKSLFMFIIMNNNNNNNLYPSHKSAPFVRSKFIEEKNNYNRYRLNWENVAFFFCSFCSVLDRHGRMSTMAVTRLSTLKKTKLHHQR